MISASDRIQVCARFRPPNAQELASSEEGGGDGDNDALCVDFVGGDGMRARVERCVALADHAVEAITRREADDGALELVMAPHSFTNVLFRVVPKHLRTPRAAGAAAVERSPEDLAALAKAQPFVKSAMQRDGDALIGFQAYGEAQYGNEEINFFRMVVAQGDLLTTELLDHTLDTMVKHADAFEAH